MNLRVLLEKDGMYGVMGLLEHNGDFVLTSQDQRMPQLAVQISKGTRAESQKAFDEAVALTRDRGWSVLYYGRPMFG